MIKNKRTTFPMVMYVLGTVLLVISLGIAIYNYAHQASLALPFRFPIDYGEGPLLDQTLRLARGESLYHNDFSKPPYTISNYPPIFLLLQVPFAKAFGAAFWYGRTISFIAALVAALMIALTLHTLTGDWLASAFGGAMLLVFPYIQFWSLINRIDALALGLSWIGIFVLVRWNDRRWGVPLAALFLIAAIYTRQTYALAAPAGAFIWLVFMRKYRKAFELALEVGGVSLILFVLINLVTSGGFFLNIVTANVNAFSWYTVRNYAKELWNNCFYLILFIAAFLVVERFWKEHTRTWPLVLAYLIGAVISAITVGKDGSNVNYLFELAAALSLGAGAALAWVGRSHWLRVALLTVMILQVTLMTNWGYTYNPRITGKTDNADDIARLFEVVRQSNGIVLADEYMGLLPLAGKTLYYQPFEYKMLSEGRVWDQTPFLEQIVGHKFDTLIIYQPEGWDSFTARWTPAERDAINSSYNLDNVIGDTEILKPRK